MSKLIPAILAHSHAEAIGKLHALTPLTDWLQIDCLDGHFVPNQSFYDPAFLEHEIRCPNIELHLMVQDPARVIDEWRTSPFCRRVVWHIEAPIDHLALIKRCQRAGLQVGLALSPETPLDRLELFASSLDLVLLMSVQTGWSGQSFKETTLAKIETCKERFPRLAIGVDGGIDDQYIPLLSDLGVSYQYLSSTLFNHPPLIKRWQYLTHLTSAL